MTADLAALISQGLGSSGSSINNILGGMGVTPQTSALGVGNAAGSLFGGMNPMSMMMLGGMLGGVGGGGQQPMAPNGVLAQMSPYQIPQWSYMIR